MMNSRIVILIIAAVFTIGMAGAEVVVFENYKTNSFLKDGYIHIERELMLKNVGSNPIIPGELHFKLHELKRDERTPSKVSDFKAWNDYNVELKTRKVEGNEETDLVVSVWEPVLPKFTYRIYISYDLQFKPKGLFFYELKVPLEETTIPIQNNKHSLYLPMGDHITYSPDSEVKTVAMNGENYRMVSWVNRRDMVVEYSKVPLPMLGIRAVNIFWIVIILMMLALTFLLHKRLRS